MDAARVSQSNGATRPPRDESGATYPGGYADSERQAHTHIPNTPIGGFARCRRTPRRAWCRSDLTSIQNEPDFYTSYWETCLFGASEGASMEGITVAGYGQALDAVYHAIRSSDLASPPVLLGPETTGFLGDVVQRYMAGLDREQLGGIAHHLYGSTADNPTPTGSTVLCAP